ncbi:hypothetical protein ACQUQU_13760 [Thalassolituus sp. LLYu03]|uniref:hypothetical protein n=1 Tax=Thalassolituus sp. LLYu03 TaxID=3421656 RepID=UPI003D276074
MKFSICVMAALLAVPAAYAGNKNSVWMLATVSNQGTTHTRTLFFYDPAIRSISDCKDEVMRGRLNQWRYYNPPSDRSFSAGEAMNFRCVEATATPAKWIRNTPFNLTYRMRIDNNALTLAPENTYAECLSDGGNDNGSYCTSASQRVSF